MKLIDADDVKRIYKERFSKTLIDKERGIDFSEYAEQTYDKFDDFIDSIPKSNVLEELRATIESIPSDGLIYKETVITMINCYINEEEEKNHDD